MRIAAQTDTDGHVEVLRSCEVRHLPFREIVGHGRRIERQRIRNHFGRDQQDAGIEVAGKVSGGPQRFEGTFDIGEDDVDL